MRWVILFMAITIVALAIEVITLSRNQASPRQDAFLRWETCVLNNQPHCGPMPQP